MPTKSHNRTTPDHLHIQHNSHHTTCHKILEMGYLMGGGIYALLNNFSRPIVDIKLL